MIHKSYLIEQNINLLSNKIVLIYGENIGLIENIRNRIKKNNTNAEIIYLNQDEILKDEELFFNKVLNISLFNESKVFLINQINDKILEIIKNIETKIKTQKIYLFSGLLEKRSKIRSYFEKSTELGILPCYADNEITIRKIISNKLKGYSGLSNQIINNLISNCGLDRSKLDNEINKIVSLFNDKKIDETKLGTLLNISENDKFDLLKDQALLGIKDKTNKLISETQLESEKNVFYLSVINSRLIKLLNLFEVKKNCGLEEAIDKVQPPIFWKDKPTFIAQLKKWNEQKIKLMLNKIYNLEIRIKSNSVIDNRILIKMLLIDLCNLANS